VGKSSGEFEVFQGKLQRGMAVPRVQGVTHGNQTEQRNSWL